MQFFRYSFVWLCFVSAFALLGNVKPSSLKVHLSRWISSRLSSPPTPQTVTNSNDDNQLLVDLSDRRVYFYQNKKLKVAYPIAIGKKDWPTPIGKFQILEKKRNPAWIQPLTKEIIPAGKNNPLGDRWIGFWSDGVHKIGFHGTNKEKSVGGAVSHGCLRMLNDDIRNMYAQVKIGTTVIVQE